MMMGVAQVIGMKPILRFVFSGGPPAAKASVAAFNGRNWPMAASAVDAPTACRKARRAGSVGNSARTTALSTSRPRRNSSSSARRAASAVSRGAGIHDAGTARLRIAAKDSFRGGGHRLRRREREAFLDRQRGIPGPFVPRAEIRADVLDDGPLQHH